MPGGLQMHEQLAVQQVLARLPMDTHLTSLLKNKACIPYLYEIYILRRDVGWGGVYCMSALWPTFISKITKFFEHSTTSNKELWCHYIDLYFTI